MNIERYRMVMWRIWADLRGWDQQYYHMSKVGVDIDAAFCGLHACGTTHCVAGWCQVLAAMPGSPYDIARDWLELTERQAEYLFFHNRTLDDLNAVLKRGRVFP